MRQLAIALHGTHKYNTSYDRQDAKVSLPFLPLCIPYVSRRQFDISAMSVLVAAPAAIDPSQGAFSTAAYLRIASLSIAAYEYVVS
jgi:purine nucleoside permease